MNARTHALAIAAGLAAFLLVGVAVTELAARWIEFSLLVGIPAGLAAGALVTAGVYAGLGSGASAERRRYALSVAGFGAAFVLVLVGGAAVANLSVTLSVVAGAAVGLVVAVATFLTRRPRGPGSVRQ